FYGEKLTVNEFLHLSEMRTDVSEELIIEKKHRKFFDYGLKPSFRTYLNDPSGFFKYRLGVEGWVALHPWRGSSFIAGLEGYPLNTVSTTNEPLSRPVRSDVVPYLQENVVLSMLMFDQIEKFKHEIYGRIAGGILEVEYAGLDGELAKPLFDGRLMVGISGSLVKKREPGQPFKFKEDDWRDYWGTAFVNTRLNIPEQEMAIDLKTGQFLAGDNGTRITLLKFFNGVILSAWYSVTNTSIFTDPFNNGYHDKGIAVTIPLRLFSGKDTRTAYNFSVSPWTRDVAQDIDHYHTLFDYIGRDTRIYLEKDKKMIMQ
ncbi:MAG: YjbH domain-containing protein, partial [Syntrophales bacterium]